MNSQLLISDICSRLNVDGLRGDIVVNRAAKAYVAYDGRSEVTETDVAKVITLCLNHRCGDLVWTVYLGHFYPGPPVFFSP